MIMESLKALVFNHNKVWCTYIRLLWSRNLPDSFRCAIENRRDLMHLVLLVVTILFSIPSWSLERWESTCDFFCFFSIQNQWLERTITIHVWSFSIQSRLLEQGQSICGPFLASLFTNQGHSRESTPSRAMKDVCMYVKVFLNLLLIRDHQWCRCIELWNLFLDNAQIYSMWIQLHLLEGLCRSFAWSVQIISDQGCFEPPKLLFEHDHADTHEL
jgi:hypothetical protein